jgi:hypothetical protein
MSRIDYDNNGYVDIKEFVAATINFKGLSNDILLRKAF